MSTPNKPTHAEESYANSTIGQLQNLIDNNLISGEYMVAAKNKLAELQAKPTNEQTAVMRKSNTLLIVLIVATIGLFLMAILTYFF